MATQWHECDGQSVGRTELPQVAVVVGTRPEIIKLAFVVHGLGACARMVHTGQYYDEALAGTFFDAFGMPRPREVVLIGRLSRGEQIGEGTRSLIRLWSTHRPDIVVVQGDTNSTLAGALAANALDISLAHVEAGLRSFDRNMPEEHNRVLIGRLADLCLAPTEVSYQNLVREGITAHIDITGNTVVEAVQAMPVVLPVHPRTAKRIADFGLQPLLEPIRLIPALDYPAFLALAAEASLLISDSGGIREEATILKRPLVVVRRSTERPEILGTFGQLVNPEQLQVAAEGVLRDLNCIHATLATLPSPYGNGEASHLVVLAIQALMQRRRKQHVTPGKVRAASDILSHATGNGSFISLPCAIPQRLDGDTKWPVNANTHHTSRSVRSMVYQERSARKRAVFLS